MLVNTIKLSAGGDILGFRDSGLGTRDSDRAWVVHGRNSLYPGFRGEIEGGAWRRVARGECAYA